MRELWVLPNGKATVMVAISDAPNDDAAQALAAKLIAAINRYEKGLL